MLNALADGNSFVAGPTDYQVVQSGTPGMSVVVTLGKAYHYIGSKSSYFGSYLDTSTTLSVASNSSGSTRIDIVCVKFDTSVSSDSVGGNIATLQYVQGTPGAGIPATPANYTKMAEVSVANGATSIVNANITDRRVNLTFSMGAAQFVGLVNGTPSSPPAGAYKAYFKTDGNLYGLNSSGVESSISKSSNTAGANATGLTQAITSVDATDTDIAGATVTLTTTGKPCLVNATVTGVTSVTTDYWIIYLHLDGAPQVHYAYGISPIAGKNTSVPITFYSTPAAGSHTWKLAGAVAAGGQTLTVKTYSINVVELK